MRVIIETENGNKKEFSSTLEAFAYEHAGFMISEKNVDTKNKEEFQKMLAASLYEFLCYNEHGFNYDELENIFEKTLNEMQNTDEYLIKISYSWGDEESDIKYDSKEAAWQEAKSLAIKEAEVYGTEHGCEVGITFEPENNRIKLHYSDNEDEYCYYDVVKW